MARHTIIVCALLCLAATVYAEDAGDDCENIDDSTVDFCALYTSACNSFLDDIACPSGSRGVAACRGTSNIREYQPTCKCGGRNGNSGEGVDATAQIQSVVFDSVTSGGAANELTTHFRCVVNSTLVEEAQGNQVCAQYREACDFFLARIDCPDNLKRSRACQNVDDIEAFGSSGPYCECRNLKVGARLHKKLFDAYSEDTIVFGLAGFFNTPARR